MIFRRRITVKSNDVIVRMRNVFKASLIQSGHVFPFDDVKSLCASNIFVSSHAEEISFRRLKENKANLVASFDDRPRPYMAVKE